MGWGSSLVGGGKLIESCTKCSGAKADITLTFTTGRRWPGLPHCLNTGTDTQLVLAVN